MEKGSERTISIHRSGQTGSLCFVVWLKEIPLPSSFLQRTDLRIWSLWYRLLASEASGGIRSYRGRAEGGQFPSCLGCL